MARGKYNLTLNPPTGIMPIMTQIALTPECLDIANAYLVYGSAKETAEQLQIPEYQVVQLLERKDVKDYIKVYIVTGKQIGRAHV